MSHHNKEIISLSQDVVKDMGWEWCQLASSGSCLGQVEHLKNMAMNILFYLAWGIS
jgi:hypothetical protein